MIDPKVGSFWIFKDGHRKHYVPPGANPLRKIEGRDGNTIYYVASDETHLIASADGMSRAMREATPLEVLKYGW